MKRIAICLIALALATIVTQRAEAQWATRVYHPVWVAPQPAVVHRAPVVVQRPPVVYTRHRPILGGTVVRTRPGGRYVVW
jgi:hypothetical protein